jgi:hypothetical protein
MRVKANQKVQIMKRFEQPIKIVPKEHNNFGKHPRLFYKTCVNLKLNYNFSWG